MDFYRLLDITAFVASLAMIAAGVWWYTAYSRKSQEGPSWVNLVFYVGQAILTADAWVNPNSWWIRAIHTAGLALLTGLHAFHWYLRWERREHEKACREFVERLEG